MVERETPRVPSPAATAEYLTDAWQRSILFLDVMRRRAAQYEAHAAEPAPNVLDYKAELVYFMGIDRAKFRKPVLPGDTIHYHVRKIRNRGRVWRFFGEAKVNGATVAEAEVSAMLADTAEARAFAAGAASKNG